MQEPEYAFTERMQEQRRLASQAEPFDPLTERVFRAAGLEPGTSDGIVIGSSLVGAWGAHAHVAPRGPRKPATRTAHNQVGPASRSAEGPLTVREVGAAPPSGPGVGRSRGVTGDNRPERAGG
jgi:hypothetical protein